MKYRFISAVLLIAVLLCTCLSTSAIAEEPDGNGLDFETIDQHLEEDIKKYHFPGMAVIVVDKDSVLFAKGYGTCSGPDQPFIIGSMSKSFTALAVMQLVEQGKIDLDRPMDDYIDSSGWFIPGTDHGRITVRNLLTHTSGIATYQTFGSLESTGNYGTYQYSNPNYGLLSMIVEEVSGMPWDEYITRNILDPLGMTHSAASLEKSHENGLIAGYRNYFGIPIPGAPDYPGAIRKGMWESIPSGYITSSASDMGRYLQMYLRSDDPLVSSESIRRMFTETVPAESDRYGFAWFDSSEVYGQPIIEHSGNVENYISHMFILPEKGIAVAVLINMNDYFVGNSLYGYVVRPLLGDERTDVSGRYIGLHLAIDAIYILLFVISLTSLFSLKKWKTRAKSKGTAAVDILRHVILPAVLLSLPAAVSTPYMVIWLYVKDLFLVLISNAAILLGVGVFKVLYLIPGKRIRYHKITLDKA